MTSATHSGQLRNDPLQRCAGAVQPNAIAVVGLACRFPGAADQHEYFALLREQRVALRRYSATRWCERAVGVGAELTEARIGEIDDVDAFDWRAFRISPREASRMDPQQRLLLELAWEAVSDAGVPLSALANSETGVFVGCMGRDHLQRLFARDGWIDGYAISSSGASFLANRISHAFDLRGPSFVVDAACASSLVAVHDACRALRAGECSSALVGAVNVVLSESAHLGMLRSNLLSSDGCPRPFDARGDGFVRGEGGAVLMLKRAEDVTARDRVYALIKGSAVGHNGGTDWIMAASAAAQSHVARRAHAEAGIDGRELEYVELHAPGFARGDAVELAAMAAVVGEHRTTPCAFGSVKGNIGHLEAASGMSALVKVILGLSRRCFLPTVPVEQPSEKVGELTDNAVVLQQTARALSALPWGAVNSTSYGGTNAHVVMRAAPDLHVPLSDDDETFYVVPVSAYDPLALEARLVQLATFVVRKEPCLACLAYTTSLRSEHLSCRALAYGRTHGELANVLRALGERSHGTQSTGAIDRALPATPGWVAALANEFESGITPAWPAADAPHGVQLSLPVYPWQRELLRLDQAQRQSDADSRQRAAEMAAPRANSDWQADLSGNILAAIRHILELPDTTTLDASRSFAELGMSSASMLLLRAQIEAGTRLQVPISMLFDAGRPAQLAQQLRLALEHVVPETADTQVARNVAGASV